jgi:TRAP-type transport system periplasmic protein
MRLARRTFLTSVMASAAAAPALLQLARADTPPITLKLHHSFSAVSGPHERFLVPWARKVEAESGGRIRIDIFPSMQLGGAPAQLFDQARDGVAEIAWAAPGATPGRFAKVEAFELPFLLSRRALVNSRAIEDFAAANLRDEFREVRALGFSCRDHGVLHANRAIAAIADLKGLRLHVPNRLAGEAARALGAAAVTVPLPQIPMALAGHVIEACLDPWDAVPALRLGEVLKAHTDFAESALSSSTFMLVMNRAAYDRLPRDLKAVVDNNSGQVAAGMAGAMWDLEARAVANMARDRGDTVTLIAADELAPWRKATEPVIAAWRKQAKERRFDGGKLIASIAALLAKYASEPEPQSPQLQAPEQKVVAEPQQPASPKTEFARPKADAPAAMPSPSPAAPVAQPAPAAATRPKELDIPL